MPLVKTKRIRANFLANRVRDLLVILLHTSFAVASILLLSTQLRVSGTYQPHFNSINLVHPSCSETSTKIHPVTTSSSHSVGRYIISSPATMARVNPVMWSCRVPRKQVITSLHRSQPGRLPSLVGSVSSLNRAISAYLFESR